MSTGKTPLPADIVAKIAADFAAEPIDRILALLDAYQGVEKARVLRCVLHLANGNLGQLRQLVGNAKTDYRDVIYWAEYDRDDRQVHDFHLPFVDPPTVRVYQWKSDLEARWLTTRREEDMDRLDFDGTARRAGWTPLAVEWILDEPGDGRRKITDCPNLASGVPALSARATIALRPQLAGVGELLPLSHPTQEYFALNVTNVVDALDEEHSDLTRFGSSGRVMRVKAYVFRAQALGPHAVFKDQRLARNTVFVTEPFVRAVEQARLTGFDFRPVWPDNAR